MTQTNAQEDPARPVVPISKDTLMSLKEHEATIIEKAVEASMRRTDEVAHHGEEAVSLISSGMQFTLKMVETAMSFGDLAILDDEIRWALDRLPHDGVLPEHIVSRFEILKRVIRDVLLPEQAAQIVPYFEWMEARISRGSLPETSYL